VEVTALAARARIPERITATLVSEGADRSTALRKTAALHPGATAGDPAEPAEADEADEVVAVPDPPGAAGGD
jgi:hypothetical protein